MAEQTLTNGKRVGCSEPYRVSSSNNLCGRENEVKMIFASWLSGEKSTPLSPLLVGAPGVGKNRLIYELAQRTGLSLFILQGHEDITSEDLACSVRFSEEGGGKMDYVLSPLVTAMMEGGICFIDEIGKIRPRALALLASVLDERRYIDSALLGTRVHAAPGFRFISATNTEDVIDLPEFIKSRMRPVINVGNLPHEEINKIIEQQAGVTSDNIKEILEHFWQLWGTRIPVPRDAIHLLALASSLSAYDRINYKQMTKEEIRNYLESKEMDIPIKPVHLIAAHDELFADKK
jgi:MoxR-like ATPase